MHRADPELAIATDDGLAMFRLPYGDDERFGMEVLLPDGDVPLDELLSELNLDVRQELGIVSAFGRGDFTPRSSANPWLDAVMQTTYLRIDEGGTEAEAVTGGVMDESGGPPPLLVDRPFAFTVSARQTGTILLLGTVHDPRS